MATRARVTLTSLNGDLTPAERVLTLDIDQPSIQVGRASKTISKGLQGARENAWFDSPVMSRDHAELSYDPETSILNISDIGSMHGTTVNSISIAPNVPTELNDGDYLAFGTEVRRGPEIFPACSFRINYELSKYRPSNVYCFPDSSDIEDEATFEFSDIESESDPTNDDEFSINSAQPKTAQGFNTIDLTGEDFLDEPSRHSIDLTQLSETSSEPKQGTHTTTLEQLKDRDETESVNKDSSDYGSDDESDLASGNASNDGIDSEEDFSDASREISDSEDSLMDDESEAESESARQPPNLNEIPSSWTSDVQAEDHALAKSLYDTQEDKSHDNSEILPSINDHLQNYTSLVIPSRSHSPEQHQIPNQHVNLIGNGAIKKSYLYSTIPDSYPSHEIQPSQPRDSSPSDAAMARAVHSTSTSSTRWSLFDDSTTTLGAGSGKEDFFKAREENRAVLQRMGEGEHEAAGSVTKSEKITSDETRRVLKLRVKAPYCSSSLQSPSNIGDSASGTGPEAFSPVSDPMASSPIANVTPQIPVSVRAVLRIDDIIDRTTPEPKAPALKRKIDEISTTMEEEVRAWASVIAPSASSTTAISSTEAVSILERPNKRLRTVLEKVGYAALGGVAVGAALFGSLVATAPDFL